MTGPAGPILRCANSVVSFIALGDNSVPSDVGKAADYSSETYTTMGNTSAPLPAPQRLRVTLGFPYLCLAGPVGGIAELPEAASAALQAGDSSGRGMGILAGVAAAVMAGVVTLGVAAWYARRRRAAR